MIAIMPPVIMFIGIFQDLGLPSAVANVRTMITAWSVVLMGIPMIKSP